MLYASSYLTPILMSSTWRDFTVYITIWYLFFFSELVTQLSSPDIEGVYESNIPLVFRVIVSLGCVCIVNKTYTRMVLNGVCYTIS